jgi:RNA polymerase sigma-70 factor (ECF subfamily)
MGSTKAEAASDADLIRRALDVDPSALADVIRRHERSVFNYLARRAGTSAAQDLLSEVWAAAIASLPSYDTAWLSARPWLFGIARNRLRTHRRSIRAQEREAEPYIDPWPEVDERLVAKAAAERLRGAVESLREVERETLLLVVWEELTPAEVAVVMQVPAATVRTRLHRARAQLRASLDESGCPGLTASER